MSESVGRAYLPTGQSLSINRENRERRRPTGAKKPRPGQDEEQPPAPAGTAGDEDIEDTGHLDVLI
ncbi:MAG: hypothetical protein WCK05_07405 [Planctomycetota bacterium]